ncbi:MAG: M20/M25/M40 family metallo-hydrolase [Wenzhouxiangella sp.]|nr:M20/M25/M40 family metallo-hydrolase [Wenzhouxiangella sp.]
MLKNLFVLAAYLFAVPLVLADTEVALDPDSLAVAHVLSEQAKTSDLAYEITESLTTEIGPRFAGTAQEARARDWAVQRLTGLGFENVRVEEFEMDFWTRGRRGQEAVSIIAPYPQELFATALGGSAGTPEGGLEAEVAFFDSFDDLLAFDDAQDALQGKIVYVNDRMVATRTGAGYGPANRKRTQAWIQAEDRGAVGVLIRSVGTSNNRFPHTGMMSRPEGRTAQIPAMALAAPDADQMERIHERGQTITVRMNTDAGWQGSATSGNVIGEIVGSEAPEDIVIIGAHLDSWDNSPGALDDGAGVGIVTAAAKIILDSGQRPRRTIRVVLFGAEEVGLLGARAYAEARAADGTLANHVIGSESDLGAREVWQLTSNVAEHAYPFFDAMQREMQHLGILRGPNSGSGGPDMIPLQRLGMPVARLNQNGEDMFEFHHTPNDTFDKIVPAEMAQNVAAWVMFTWLVADTDLTFRAAGGNPSVE